MTLRNRILDLLPVILVFTFVSAFTAYVTVAYVLRDPWWLRTVAAHVEASSTAAPQHASDERTPLH